MNLDQYDDINSEYMEKLANSGLIIKKRDDVSDLPDKDFALIIVKKRKHRKFPINNRDNTLLSLLYFLKNMNELPETFNKIAGAKIKEACIKYDLNIPSKLDGYNIGSKINIVKEANEKKDILDSQFGLIIKKDGKKIRKFPMPDKEHVLKAIQFYPEVKDNLNEEQKKILLNNISEKVKEYGIDTEIEKNASFSLAVNPNVMRDMEFRIRNLDKKSQEPYIKLSKKVEEKEVNIKQASVLLDRLDKENNYDYRKMPAEEVFLDREKTNSIKKFASTNFFNTIIRLKDGIEKIADNEEIFSDTIIRLKDDPKSKKELEKKFKENFDESLANDLITDPETIFESLPDPHKEMIKNIINEVRY